MDALEILALIKAAQGGGGGLPASTKYGKSLAMVIDPATFVVTAQLKDQNGDNLGTAQTIDLPLESVVVGGSYNDNTKKVVLTLQNGNTVEFSVADLVAGLQSQLSAANKLDPAFIDYNSTHRAVSDTEKTAWNGKQSALSSAQLSAVNSGINSIKVAQIETNENNISNLTMSPYVVSSGSLNDITTNTYAMYTGDVSNRPSTDGTWYFVKTTTFDSTTMYQEAVAFNANESTYTRIKRSNTWQAWHLSNLTNNQYRAVNSGVNAELVSQISANQTEIARLVDDKSKNVLNITKQSVKTENTAGTWNGDTYTRNGMNITINGDMTFTVDGEATGSFSFTLKSTGLTGLQGYVLSGGNPDSNTVSMLFQMKVDPWTNLAQDFGTGVTIAQYDDTKSVAVAIYFSNGATADNLVIKPMICSANSWNFSHEFVPYAPSNAELYRMLLALS